MAALQVVPTPLVLRMGDERVLKPLVMEQLALSTWAFVFEIWVSVPFLSAAVIGPLDNKTFRS